MFKQFLSILLVGAMPFTMTASTNPGFIPVPLQKVDNEGEHPEQRSPEDYSFLPTINGDLAFYAGKKIFMNQNSTLIIDGGILVDPTLDILGADCTVKIMNGGKIGRHKKSDFALPYGISLEMDAGSIFE